MSLQRVLRCCAGVNPHCSKQRPCRPQVSSSSAVVFTAMRANQLDFYISIVLAVSCSYSVFAGGQISAVPIQIYMVRTHILSDVGLCVSLHVYVWVCMDCLCIVCAGSYSRFLMMRVHILLLSEPRLSKHSQLCGVQLWRDWWAPLNCKPAFRLIGMLFWFKYPAWRITAADNTHNTTLQYVSSGSCSD